MKISNIKDAIGFLGINQDSRRINRSAKSHGCNITPRWGKTKKDRDSGALGRNISNKTRRDSYVQQGGEFPTDTCNGHRYYRRIRRAA